MIISDKDGIYVFNILRLYGLNQVINSSRSNFSDPPIPVEDVENLSGQFQVAARADYGAEDAELPGRKSSSSSSLEQPQLEDPVAGCSYWSLQDVPRSLQYVVGTPTGSSTEGTQDQADDSEIHDTAESLLVSAELGQLEPCQEVADDTLAEDLEDSTQRTPGRRKRKRRTGEEVMPMDELAGAVAEFLKKSRPSSAYVAYGTYVATSLGEMSIEDAEDTMCQIQNLLSAKRNQKM